MQGDSLKSFVVLLALIALLSFGCLGSEMSSYTGGSATSGEAAPSLAMRAPAADSSGQYVTKESDITIRVPTGSLESKFSSTKTMLTEAGAQTSGVTYNEYSDRKQYTLTIKIPPAKFDAINAQLKTVGEVKDMSVSLEDVTKQYTDLDTRIKNQELELERLYVLYNRSDNISDLLQVEREITRVETELELLKQEKQDLVAKIDLSTITVTIYEDTPATQQITPSMEGLGSLFFGALAVAITLIVGLAGFLLPLVIVVVVLWFVYKKLKGNQPRPRKSEHDQIPPPR